MLKWKAYDNDIYNDDITKHFEVCKVKCIKNTFFLWIMKFIEDQQVWLK